VRPLLEEVLRHWPSFLVQMKGNETNREFENRISSFKVQKRVRSGGLCQGKGSAENGIPVNISPLTGQLGDLVVVCV
jgi:hypothetical protein